MPSLQLGEELGPVLVDRAVTKIPDREHERIAIPEVICHRRVVAMARRSDDGLVGRVLEPVDGDDALSGLEQPGDAVRSSVHRSRGSAGNFAKCPNRQIRPPDSSAILLKSYGSATANSVSGATASESGAVCALRTAL